MKRIYAYILFIMCVCYTCAQTQQGIVKTRGRMVNGQLVAGQRLSGATITLNFGNALVSGSQGGFSFNVPTGKTYSLVMAKKQGYTLADPEYTRRSFKYSVSNPFYVVLEDETQRQADINAATRKVRRTLTAQLQKREDEIEALKEQNKLSEEEYQKRLQELYDNQSKSELLVKEMAERYATTDYDQLDEFNRQVQLYIEEGELQKADSMIRSKGDMEQRVTEYHNVVAANKKEREQLEQRERNLEQSESGATKAYDDLSQDLYRRHEIFMQEFKQDSALYCLKLRADLDTMKADCSFAYANLCTKQKLFQEGEKYYLISLRVAERNKESLKTIKIQKNIAALYESMNDFKRAEIYYQSSIDSVTTLFRQCPNSYRLLLAQIQQDFGEFYCTTRNFQLSEKFLKSAMENIQIYLNHDTISISKDLGHVTNNLGTMYNLTKDYKQADIYYKRSFAIFEELYRQNPNEFRYELSKIENNMAGMYSNIHDYTDSEKFYLLSLEHKEILYKENPGAYRMILANVFGNLGILYKKTRDFEKSEKYLLLSLQHKEELFRLNPYSFRASLSNTQNSLGGLYHVLKDYEKSEKYYLLALENRKELYKQYPKVYNVYLTATQLLLTFVYKDTGRYEDALNLLDKSMDITPDNYNLYHTKGEILLMQGKNEDALEIWKKVLELNPNFLKDYPDGTNLSNGLKKLGLIE